MKAGDVVFVRGNSLTSRIIRFFDKGRFSHVCIAMSKEYVLETDLFKKVGIYPFSYSDYEIIRLNITDEQRKQLMEVAQKYIGKNYDWRQLFYYVFKSLWKYVKFQWFNTPNEFICSELAYKVLVDIGVLKDCKKFVDITPNELYRLLERRMSDEIQAS